MTAPHFEMLTDDERRQVEDRPAGDFVQAFIDRAALKTNASPYLLEAAALAALSLSAGEAVVLENYRGTGPRYLNLYILVIGPSTRSRKSTALGMLTDVLPHGAADRPIVRTVIDASPEALVKEIAEAAQVAAPVFYRVDEVAGLLDAAAQATHYLRRVKPVLLQAYDHDPIHIARTGGTVDAPDGGFLTMFGATTIEPLAAALHGDDLASGLVPRFLVFEVSGAQMSTRVPAHIARANGPEFDARGDDLRATLKTIARPQAHLAVKTQTEPEMLTYTEDAIERIDILDALIDSQGAGDEFAAVLGRGIDRVEKLAGLYALSRAGTYETEVTLPDVLRAIRLVETTTDDLWTMRERMAVSPFEKLIDDLMAILDASPNGAVPLERLAVGLRPFEVREAIDAMTMRGLAAHHRASGLVILTKGTMPGRIQAVLDVLDTRPGEWLTATEIDALTGKRGVGQVLDVLASATPDGYETRRESFPKKIEMRAKAKAAVSA